MSEWKGGRRSRYEEEWGHQMEMDGNMIIEYDNMRVYEKVPDHLMRDLKLSERRTWRMSDGMFVVEYNRDKGRQQFKYEHEEHMDMSGTIKKCEILFPMPRTEIKIKEVVEALERIKKWKHPGPDRLKGKIYRGLNECEKLILYLTQAYNAVLNEGMVPEGWKGSKTVMIPKTGKPTAKEHRQIALTNVRYKIFMGLLKSKLVEHLEGNRLISDYQAGFTGGRRLEENLSIVRYCIE